MKRQPFSIYYEKFRLEATRAYRSDSDRLRDFLADRCILDSSAHVSVADLWQAYVDWALQSAEAADTRADADVKLHQVPARDSPIGDFWKRPSASIRIF